MSVCWALAPGQGVARILSANAAEIERRTGRAIEVTRASVRNVGKAEALELGIDITTDSASIVNDPDIDIVCEVMGGEDPALSLLKLPSRTASMSLQPTRR